MPHLGAMCCVRGSCCAQPGGSTEGAPMNVGFALRNSILAAAVVFFDFLDYGQGFVLVYGRDARHALHDARVRFGVTRAAGSLEHVVTPDSG